MTIPLHNKLADMTRSTGAILSSNNDPMLKVFLFIKELLMQ